MSIVTRTPLVVPLRPGMREPVDRFADKVALTETGCLEWQGYRNRLGYGKFYVGSFDGKKKVIASAYRWSYFWHHGPIPDELVVDHLCRNPACVHPDHLEAVTLAENNRRVPPELKGNGGRALRKSHCNQGHPLADPNLYYQPKNGKRFCKTCRDERTRKYNALQKARRNGVAA